MKRVPRMEVTVAGTKNDAKKAPMDLLPPAALLAISRVFGYGAEKYGRFNYREGISYSRLAAAALRHITAFVDGEDADSETGESHLAHAGCCVMMALQMLRDHPELDDRYKKEKKDADLEKYCDGAPAGCSGRESVGFGERCAINPSTCKYECGNIYNTGGC